MFDIVYFIRDFLVLPYRGFSYILFFYLKSPITLFLIIFAIQSLLSPSAVIVGNINFVAFIIEKFIIVHLAHTSSFDTLSIEKIFSNRLRQQVSKVRLG